MKDHQNQEQIQYLDYVPPKNRRKWQRSSQLKCIQPDKIVKTQTEVIVKQKIVTSKSIHLQITAHLDEYDLVCVCGKYSQFQSDALILPYVSANLQYYPSCQLQEYLENDVEKLKSLKSKGSKGGDLYLKSKKICRCKFRAYIKVEQQSINQFVKGINSLIELINSKNISIKTICIAYPQKLFDLQDLLKIIISELICKTNLKIIIVFDRNQLFAQAFTILNSLIPFSHQS